MFDDAPIEVDTPWRREPAELAKGLTAWAAAELGDDVEVLDFSAPDNGMSSETVLFSLRRGEEVDRYVARLAPAPDVFPVFPDYDLELQARAMRLVAERTPVPVPTTPWLVSDSSWLGSPFLVMGRVDGVVPLDVPPYVFGGWVQEASPEDRARLQEAAVQVLVDLHALTPTTADLSFLPQPGPGQSALDAQLAYQRWYYDWAREDVRYPLIERTFEWLDAHRPPESDPVLNWGDSRIGNVLWHDFEPVAVLDWEMVTLGPPEVDIAWLVFLHTFFQDIAERFGMPGIPGFLQLADVVAAYERLSGRTVQGIEWYEVFAALRFAIISVRTSMRGIAFGQAEQPEDPHDLIMFRTLLEQMLDGTYWS